jgi:hypothetical protein
MKAIPGYYRSHPYLLRSIITTLFCVFWAACSTQKDVDSVIVYVTPTGSRYHLSNCRYLGERFTTVLLRDVDEKGYQACSYCMPPLSTPINKSQDTVVIDKYVEQKDAVTFIEGKQTLVQCTGITKKGVQCSRKVKSPDHKCFQHKRKR